MSSASNLGYGNITPLSNVNGNYANIDNSHFSGRFSSNEIPGPPGLSGAKSNIDAASSTVPGVCLKGGSLKRKIKNITKHYMKAGSRRIKSIKRRLRHRALSRKLSRSRSFAGGRRHRRHTHRRHRHRGSMRGGYAQYQNNMPMTSTYQVAGIQLSPSESALANPAPITKLANCVNCVDNYNAYTMKGFPSQGH